MRADRHCDEFDPRRLAYHFDFTEKIADRILSCLIVPAPDLFWLVISTNCASVNGYHFRA